MLERAGAPDHVMPMQKDSAGFFSLCSQEARPGDLYRYEMKGTRYPDPASRFQPQGVHGPSQIVDPKTFHWTDSGWAGIPIETLIIYELHVGTFTPEGTFSALKERLHYLADLGITAIELMPLADFAGKRNWGYDGVAPFAPARCYGTPDDLRRLIDTAHHLGLAVFIDVVYNHLGPDGNYTGAFSPFYTNPRYSSPWGQALNFDGPNSQAVREFFIQNALHWIYDYHADGLRLDATHAIQDASQKHFLLELQERVQALDVPRLLYLVAEDNRNEIALIKEPERGGYGLSMVWSDDFHHQMRRLLAGDRDGYYADFKDSTQDLATILNRGWLYAGQPSVFTGEARGTNPDGAPLERFVFFLQNHDQIGNRAFGDRLSHQISPAAYRAATVLLLCSPQTPLLFMGQEWAATTPFLYFTDHHQELGKAVTEGRKMEFKSFLSFLPGDPPDPQAPATFERSKLSWPERGQEPHQSIWLLYQALLLFRKEHLGLRKNETTFKATALDDSTMMLERQSRAGKAVLVVVRLKEVAGEVDLAKHLTTEVHPSNWELYLSSEDRAYCTDSQPPVVRLSGEAPVIEFSRAGAVILMEHSPSHG